MLNRGSKFLIGLMALGALLFLFGLRDPFLPRVAPSDAEGTSPRLSRLDSPGSSHWSDRLLAIEAENRDLKNQVRELDSLQTVLRDRLESLEATPRLRPLQDYPLPDSIGFCGEMISLADARARERFEPEFYRFLVNRHWLVDWMHRSREVFPLIQTRIAQAGLPDDLKYIAVIESSLDARAVSRAGAVGYWQFTGSTGRRFGLVHNRNMDQRRDLAEATDAALRYLKELHEEFHAWSLSLAAYNAGENRVRDAMKNQAQSNYHRLVLPKETEAYWYKAAAVKLFFEHPTEYDFDSPGELWRVVPCDTLVVAFSRQTPILNVLGDSGMDYREFKNFNPAYRRPLIPAGRHRLAIPHRYSAAISSRFPKARLELSEVFSTPSRP